MGAAMSAGVRGGSSGAAVGGWAGGGGPGARNRSGLGEVVNGLLVLAVEEERRGRGAGGDRVDGDVLTAQLAGQDEGHALHGGLRGDVAAVGRKLRPGNRGGEVDERAAGPQAVSGELGDDEGATDVGAVHP